MTTTVLTRRECMSVEAFADAAALHPELVARFIRLGLLDATFDRTGTPMLRLDQLARVARIQRLRAGLSLNYAALGLVMDLLDRIESLEGAQRRPTPHGPHGGRTRRWIPTA